MRPTALRFSVLSCTLALGLVQAQTAQAQATQTQTSQAQGAQTVTLPAAASRALTSGPDLKTAQTNLQQAQSDLAAKQGDPGTLVAPLTQAKNTLQLAQLQLDNTRLSVVQNVVSAHTALLAAQQNVEVQTLQSDFDARSLKVAQVKLAANNATALDVQNAQNTLAGSQQALADARAQLPILSQRLAKLLGASGATLRANGLPDVPPLKVSLANLSQNLETRSPAVLRASQAVALDQLNVKLANNDYTPRQTLLDAQTGLANDQRTLDGARRDANTNLTDAYRSAQNAYQQLKIALTAETNQQTTYQQNQARLKSGTISAVDLQNSQVALKKAQFARLQAQNAVWSALSALSVAAGTNLTGLTDGT